MWLGLGTLRALSVLPLPVLCALGGAIGTVGFAAVRSRREVVLCNLRACFPELSEKQRIDLAREHFKFLSRCVLATGIPWWSSAKRLNRLVQCTNRHHLDDARERGPVILLVPHFTALEVAGFYLALNTPLVTMYQRAHQELFDTVQYNARRRFGIELVERKGALRKIVRLVRKGKVFFYLPDQDPGKWNDGVFAPFMGVPAYTHPTLCRFARLTQATVVPCYPKMLSKGKGFELIFAPPLQDFPAEDLVEDAARMNLAVEEGVRLMPEQYFWVHKRFKSRPEGEAPFYQ